MTTMTDGMRDAVRVASDLLGVAVKDVLTVRNCKLRSVVQARWLASWLGVRVLGRSQSDIGRQIDQDHTSVRYGVLKIDAWRQASPKWQWLTDQATERLKERRRQSYQDLREGVHAFVIDPTGNGRAI